MPSFEAVTDGRAFDELDPADPETIRYSCEDSDKALRLYYLFNGWFDKYLPRHRWIVENIESPTSVYLGMMKYNGVPVDTELMRSGRRRLTGRWSVSVRRSPSSSAMWISAATAARTLSRSTCSRICGLPVMRTTESNRAAADDAVMIQLKEWCDKNRPELSRISLNLCRNTASGTRSHRHISRATANTSIPVTGRIHPNFYSLSTDTGRFSCSRPNLQNAPRKTNDPIGVRNFIKAPEGHLIVSCDYSQIELRVGAFYCRDKTMMDTYKSGGDIHAATTSVIFNPSPMSRRRTRIPRITRNTARSPRTSTSARSTACSRADSRRPSSSRRGLINPSRSVKRSSET
jgi:DNA polymerase-1